MSNEAPARNDQDSREDELERETGVEPATLSLGMRSSDSAGHVTGWQASETPVVGDPGSSAPSSASAAIRTREAPIELQGIAQGVGGAEDRRQREPRAPRPGRTVSGRAAWLTVRAVACQLRVSTATVYRLIDRGELQHARISNAIRISPSDLATVLRGGSLK
ncbi:MAG: hypothetical protein AUH69_09460 [Actinobacteria bacterium 13_1_40CM_4_65_12]|nr:MAG: hypothetical protein AUH69_09460 [Actinobacteria bacterium 13_1_40CM_4_65_12]